MIPVTLLEVVIEADYPLDLGANPGASLRGALYEALAAMYDTGDPVTSRDDLDTNPVAWLLRLEDEGTSGGREVPRPMAIRPPLCPPTERMAFGVSFYGRGREAISMVLSAISAMQTIGVGRGRNGFRLCAVNVIDPISRQSAPLLNGRGDEVGVLPPAPSGTAYEKFAAVLAPDRLAVQFLTPTRIICNDALSRKPVFRVWFQRLLERIRLISELYTEPVWIPFRELLSIADRVETVSDETRWQDGWSYSRYDGTRKPTGGFIGNVTYQGDFSALLPYLLVGQSLQVGKNTIKGCGWYEIKYQWC